MRCHAYRLCRWHVGGRSWSVWEQHGRQHYCSTNLANTYRHTHSRWTLQTRYPLSRWGRQRTMTFLAIYDEFLVSKYTFVVKYKTTEKSLLWNVLLFIGPRWNLKGYLITPPSVCLPVCPTLDFLVDQEITDLHYLFSLFLDEHTFGRACNLFPNCICYMGILCYRRGCDLFGICWWWAQSLWLVPLCATNGIYASKYHGCNV